MDFDLKTDLIVFSLDSFNAPHLRTAKTVGKFADRRRVYYFEVPVIGVSSYPTYFIQKNDKGVTVVKPYLPADVSVFDQRTMLEDIIQDFMTAENITHYSVWSDTPRAVPFIRKLNPELVIYDCLVDHSQINPILEREMFRRAHVVITSGLSYKNIEGLHPGFLQSAKSPSTELLWN